MCHKWFVYVYLAAVYHSIVVYDCCLLRKSLKISLMLRRLRLFLKEWVLGYNTQDTVPEIRERRIYNYNSDIIIKILFYKDYKLL